MSTPSVCVIRKYNDTDKLSVQNIITEATMEQVGRFYMSALCSDTLLKTVVVFMATGFVIFDVPFKYCLLAAPLGVALLYVLIWSGHWIKATELHEDLNNITANYLQDPSTCFYVAEYYGKSGEAELASLMNRVKKFECDIYNEKEFAGTTLNVKGLSKTIIGCIAITKSMLNVNRAWIRRMAVKKEYRRRRIGTRLILEALNFCREKKYTGADLITTECHEEAKQLYLNEGFVVADSNYKSYFGFGSRQVTHMEHSLEKPTEKEYQEEFSLRP